MQDQEPTLDPSETHSKALSRRRFLRGASEIAASSVVAHGLLVSGACSSPPTDQGSEKEPQDETLDGEVEIVLSINSAPYTVRVEPRTTLLNALRNHCEPPLTGTKLVCDRGNCGACTVLVDGRSQYACLLLAVDLRNREIRTVEGLAQGDTLSPLQHAFCEKDALMCGFCTPGFLMALTGALEKNPRASEEELRVACAGNSCRCGTYPHIFEAALAAGAQLAGGR